MTYGTYQIVVFSMIFAPLIVLAFMEIKTHIRWMRERRARRCHPTNRFYR